jgi:hypothetical protein
MPNDSARLLAGWDPYNQNTHAEFLDPEWMFSLDPKDFSGFDIVIGNPPYVRQEQIKELKPQLKQHYECFTGTADLYVFFYERGIQLLKIGGVFSFITSNKWLRSTYGDKLREWLKKNTRVRRLIDFGDAEVFEAIAYPCIVVLSKGAPPEDSAFQALTWNMEWNVTDVQAHLSGDTFTMPQRDLAPKAWRPASGTKLLLLGRIKTAGVPVGKHVAGRFYRGILTGLNEAFVVSRKKRDELIAEDPSSAKVLKPFLRGRDVKRWRVEFEGQYLTFTRHGINIKQYPAIEKHLKKFKNQLEPMPADWDVKRNGAWGAVRQVATSGTRCRTISPIGRSLSSPRSSIPTFMNTKALPGMSNLTTLRTPVTSFRQGRNGFLPSLIRKFVEWLYSRSQTRSGEATLEPSRTIWEPSQSRAPQPPSSISSRRCPNV